MTTTTNESTLRILANYSYSKWHAWLFIGAAVLLMAIDIIVGKALNVNKINSLTIILFIFVLYKMHYITGIYLKAIAQRLLNDNI